MPSPLVLYGSNVADTTITTACDMAANSGGVETPITTTITGAGNFAEITSQGLSVAAVAAIPATPTGNGWVYKPGQGTFATGNWSLLTDLDAHGWSGSSATTTITPRFFIYSGGLYTLIGSLAALGVTGALRATYSFPAVSMASVVFGASDLLYVDFWWFDGTGSPTDNPIIFESTSSTAGVAGDMQVTTSTFTPIIPPPVVTFVAPPLPFNQAVAPVTIGASKIIYGSNL